MALPTWQNPLDWLTQCWNIALGKRARPVEDNWLIGPIGAVAEQAETFIDRLSSEKRLSIQRNEPGAGLIDSMAEWGIPLNSSVADFYTKTSDYDFEVSNSWKPVFGSLGYLVAKLFSRRIQQLNLPRAGAGEMIVLRSEIIKLLEADGRTACTIWHRSIRNTGEVVFYGIYTYCLARTSVGTTLSAMCRPPDKSRVPGLVQAECMAGMQLGAPVFSAARMQLHQLVMFAEWESEEAIDDFMSKTKLGRVFSAGWHVRMRFLRQWGMVREFADAPESAGESDPDSPVVAVTLARMKLTEVPRFVRWGKPVEELVRDHPGASFAMASMRLPRTVSTFSIWHSQREMLGMVHGHGKVERPERHAAAMKERDRKDFHFEFTTLRFRPLSEHGQWQGRGGLVPS